MSRIENCNELMSLFGEEVGRKVWLDIHYNARRAYRFKHTSWFRHQITQRAYEVAVHLIVERGIKYTNS